MEAGRWRLGDGSSNGYNLEDMSFKFEKLIIWQKSMEFGEDIQKISSGFPQKELFNLTSQINRAADSMALDIAEGSILQSYPEFKNFRVTQSALWQKLLPAFIKQKTELIFQMMFLINITPKVSI